MKQNAAVPRTLAHQLLDTAQHPPMPRVWESLLTNGDSMKRIQQGFTLIELMIVVAIIGILAAIAIPQYQDYIARSQASETYALMDGLKTGIGECINLNGGVVTGCDSGGAGNAGTIPAAALVVGNYTTSVTVAAGV